MTEIFEKLAAAGIQIIPIESQRHVFFERDGFVALAERTESGFGKIGSPGLLTEKGLAMLVWRGEAGFFVARGFEQCATAEQVTTLRRFAADLEAAVA